MPDIELIAVTGFGLEAVVSQELKHLGYPNQTVRDGRVVFSADWAAICRTNLWLRSADRVLLKMGDFEATDFGQLFDRTRTLPWSQWLPEDACFPVRGKSVRSKLHSVPDCQALVKKAIVENLKQASGREWFEETGPQYTVEVSLLKDRATLSVDTSGAGLHKRGYRTLVGSAPLKETLAAALVQLSYWSPERPLIDPVCGSGTIPIEAALIGRRIAPGMGRTFAAETWPQLPTRLWDEARREARDLAAADLPSTLIGNDIDPNVLRLARHHARAAGVAENIHFQQGALADLRTSKSYGCLICNPPYGERMGDQRAAEMLYAELRDVVRPLASWSIYVLTSHRHFEKHFGRRATRRRKLYNGRIACTYYQFAGPPPPKESK